MRESSSVGTPLAIWDVLLRPRERLEFTGAKPLSGHGVVSSSKVNGCSLPICGNHPRIPRRSGVSRGRLGSNCRHMRCNPAKYGAVKHHRAGNTTFLQSDGKKSSLIKQCSSPGNAELRTTYCCPVDSAFAKYWTNLFV